MTTSEMFELERPVLAVDVVMIAIAFRELRVLLQKRINPPFQGALALPGAAVRMDETLENAARRALSEKIGQNWVKENFCYMEQLAAFDGLYRDPRGRTISVAYLAIGKNTADRGESSVWKSVDEISEGSLPFDHSLIIRRAVERLQGKVRYTNIARGFVPETFRIDTLQDVYETILNSRINRSNFRTKLLKIGMIEQVTILSEAVGEKGGRPPHLYRFTGPLIEISKRDFL